VKAGGKDTVPKAVIPNLFLIIPLKVCKRNQAVEPGASDLQKAVAKIGGLSHPAIKGLKKKANHSLIRGKAK